MDTLKEELIKPFLKSSTEILSQIANFQVTHKEPYVKKELKLQDNIGVIIGITGSIKGQAVISFTEDTAKKIASNMMGGMPIAVLDDIAKSAVCELGNLILGNAAVGLYNHGASIDITPPSILIGKEMTYSTANSGIICIPLEAKEDNMELNIIIKE